MTQKRLPPEPIDSADRFLYDLPTVARLMSTKISAIRKLIHEDKLRFVVVGNSFLISQGAIREYIRTFEKTYAEHQNTP